MINAENKINTPQTTPWSPELHTAIRTVSFWKLSLTELKPKYFNTNQSPQSNKH